MLLVRFPKMGSYWLCWLIGVFRVGGKSNVDDFTLAAEACLPIISAVVDEIKKKTYPRNCFLNIDVPTDVVHHKVCKAA